MLGNDRKMETGCNHASGLRRLICERKLVVGNTLVRFKMFGECLENTKRIPPSRRSTVSTQTNMHVFGRKLNNT